MLYEITNAKGDRLLAEAESIDQARYAARTIHSEGEPLPIHIFTADGDSCCESLVDGPFGAMISGSSLSRSLA